ncbi:MAG: hypothetical protein E7171_02630 [Firmicutes bacterium]|nr:hypothetical protein [Bacillota bacterium]
MKKKVLLALSAVLVIVLAVGASFAYQTSSTNGVNVMTFGDVEIAQHEYERATDENGKWYTLTDKDGKEVVDQYGYKPDKLQPFTQNKTIAPAFYVKGTEVYDDRVGANGDEHQQSWKEVGAPGSNQLFDDSVKNVIDKFVFVENTGNNPVFYRTIIAIECPKGFEEDGEKDYIHLLINKNSRFDWEDVGYYEIDETRYLVKVATHNEALPAGEVSRPSLLQVFLDPKATNEDVALFEGSLDVLVFSQATQVFDDEVTADMALNAAFGEVATNLPWKNSQFVQPTMNNNVMEVTENLILRDEPLYSSTTATEAVTINGNGNTITQTATNVDAFNWTGGTIPWTSNIFSSSNGAKVTVNNLNFAGTMQSIMLGHYVNSTYNNFNTELNNVNVIGLNVVSFSGGISPAVTVYGTATLNNTNIYGTKLSALDTDPMWPVYDLAVVNDTTTTINNSKIGSIFTWARALVNVNNSTIDSIYTKSVKGINVNSGSTVNTIKVLTDVNGYSSTAKITIKAGAQVDTIDFTDINMSKVALVVEDGATVKNVVKTDGTKVTYAEWIA